MVWVPLCEVRVERPTLVWVPLSWALAPQNWEAMTTQIWNIQQHIATWQKLHSTVKMYIFIIHTYTKSLHGSTLRIIFLIEKNPKHFKPIYWGGWGGGVLQMYFIVTAIIILYIWTVWSNAVQLYTTAFEKSCQSQFWYRQKQHTLNFILTAQITRLILRWPCVAGRGLKSND